MPALVCPHCHVASHFTQKWHGGIYADSSEEFGQLEVFTAFAWQCDNCQMPVCGIYDGKPIDETDLTIWPEATFQKDYPDVPEDVAHAAIEAHRALGADAPRAAVAMARAVVEAIAKGKGITKGTVQNKIDRLHAEGHIGEDMREAAHEIRFAGNEAAHGDLVKETISLKEAAEIVGLMDKMLERVYQEPAKVARVRASREARKNPQVPA
jgi:hypothetical protein